MLVLTRNLNRIEEFVRLSLPDGQEIKIYALRGTRGDGYVKLGIEPQTVVITRSEVEEDRR